MSFDPNLSPVGWYVASYQLRFIDMDKEGNDDPERRFLVWTNTILVKADNIEQAYDKAGEIGKSESAPYKGRPDAIDVRWVFEGIVEVLPIYEEIEDGAEIMWSERTRKLKNIVARAMDRGAVRRPIIARS